MSNAPTPPPHTVMSLIKAGGFDTSAEACAKALAACGINPDGFDDYSSVQESQREARDELQEAARQREAARTGGSPDRHVSPCSMPGASRCRCHESQAARDAAGDDERWLHANSESGHMAQNALFQEPGSRGDPCTNYPPDRGSPPAHSGTYGYDMDRATCMDHHGRSTQRGAPHYLVTRTEAGFARELGPGRTVTMDDMREGAARSAAVAVTGSRWEYDDDPQRTDMRRVSEANGGNVQSTFQQAQANAAQSMSSSAGGATPASSGASSMSGLSDAEKQAIACIVAEFERGIDGVQQDAVQSFGPGSDAGQANAAAAYNAENNTSLSWNQMTPQQQDQAVAARQRQLAANSAGSNPIASQRPPGHPTAAECREYQANWLWQNGCGRGNPPGSAPPMQGVNGHFSQNQAAAGSTTVADPPL